ncbi:MAG TPA: carboxypeptidase regulatory-like domain-containing protein [Polyangiaceae bacterium]
MVESRFGGSVFALFLTLVAGCGSASSPASFGADSDGGATSTSGSSGNGSAPPLVGTGTGTTSAGGGSCTGLACQVHSCSGGGSTTLSGTIFDPAGKNPLYNIGVFVPNEAPKPMPDGVTCDCNSLYTGDPIASALTDAAGHFTLQNVPDGANVPLVIQVGKWRMQTTIANVTACQDNPQPNGKLRLPKNHSEGDIPNIAISTGGADSLECLLHRVGLDDAEYGPAGSGAGHIHIFQGAGIAGASTPTPTPTPIPIPIPLPPGTVGGGFSLGAAPNTSPSAPASSAQLWDSKSDLLKYDLVLLSCEGQETASMTQQALFDYAAAGGRVFASHFHYAWFNSGPFGAANLASWTTGSNDMGSINATIDTSFPKGAALSQWLGNVGALTGGELPIQQARHNANVSSANTASQAWIAADKSATPAGATEYFTFNTPIGVPADQQCGRVVYSDLHVGAASGDYGASASAPIVPSGCASGGLSPQEKALEFMLFDLASCVQQESVPPMPPPPVPR